MPPTALQNTLCLLQYAQPSRTLSFNPRSGPRSQTEVSSLPHSPSPLGRFSECCLHRTLSSCRTVSVHPAPTSMPKAARQTLGEKGELVSFCPPTPPTTTLGHIIPLPRAEPSGSPLL